MHEKLLLVSLYCSYCEGSRADHSSSLVRVRELTVRVDLRYENQNLYLEFRIDLVQYSYGVGGFCRNIGQAGKLGCLAESLDDLFGKFNILNLTTVLVNSLASYMIYG